uniref:Uncharacterized protein n=1 Tax=Rangifer tarandus platyrhynchus TaxID=3082113 RepID=A0ACB0FC72_RANTA|nr:unnamed protein product [Rangifer tarandus platyrhynchus]
MMPGARLRAEGGETGRRRGECSNLYFKVRFWENPTKDHREAVEELRGPGNKHVACTTLLRLRECSSCSDSGDEGRGGLEAPPPSGPRAAAQQYCGPRGMTAGWAGLFPQAEEVQRERPRAPVGPAEVKILKLIHGDVVSAVLMVQLWASVWASPPEVVVVEEVRALVEQRVFMLHGAARWDLHAISPSIHPCPQDLPPDAVCSLHPPLVSCASQRCPS